LNKCLDMAIKYYASIKTMIDTIIDNEFPIKTFAD